MDRTAKEAVEGEADANNAYSGDRDTGSVGSAQLALQTDNEGSHSLGHTDAASESYHPVDEPGRNKFK